MRQEQIKPYMTMLKASNTPEALARAKRQIENLIPISDFYASMEMSSHMLELYRDKGEAHSLVQLHSHPFYEILYCRSNSDAEYLVGTNRYQLRRGDLLLIPPGTNHTPLERNGSDVEYEGCSLFLNPNFVNSLCKEFPAFQEIKNPNVCFLRTRDTIWENVDCAYRLNSASHHIL